MSDLVAELRADNAPDLRAKRTIEAKHLTIAITLELDALKTAADDALDPISEAVSRAIGNVLAGRGIRHLRTVEWDVKAEAA